MTPEEFNQRAADLIGWNFIRNFNPWANPGDAIMLIREVEDKTDKGMWSVGGKLRMVGPEGIYVGDDNPVIQAAEDVFYGLPPNDYRATEHCVSVCQFVARVLGWEEIPCTTPD